MTRLPAARLAAIALLGLAAAAWAQPPAPLRLAFNELEPWKTRQGGEHRGAYTELMRELARRVGRELAFVDCPLKRCLKLLEAGDADLIIGLQQSPERARYLHYLATPYRRSSSDRVFILRAGETRRISRYEDLLGLRIAVKQGTEYFDRFDDDARLTKDAAPSNEASLRKLMLGRVDVVLLPEDQALVQLAQTGLRGEVRFAELRVPDPTPRAVAVAKNSPAVMALLPRLEQAMREIREDGTLAALYNRHYYQRYRISRQSVVID